MTVQAILIAVDLSEADHKLLDAAQIYAQALAARVYLVHVVPSAPDFVGLPKDLEAETLEAREGVEVGYAYDRSLAAERARTARADLQSRRERLSSAGLETTALLIEGPSAAKIIAEAEKLGAGLIVVGSKQRGAVGEWLHGNVARDVLRHASCPVLVVPTD